MEKIAQRWIEATTVKPEWLPGGTKFWYRHFSEPGKFHFVLVDAVERRRDVAFDHKQLAEALEEKTGEKLDEDALPFTWIEYIPETSSVRFRFADKKWEYGLGNGLRQWEGELVSDESNKFLEKEIPSSNGAADISVEFVNRTGTTIKAFWIDWHGKPIWYHTIHNGGTVRQETYVGHVWRFVDASNEKLRAIYAAPDQSTDVVVVKHLVEMDEEAISPSKDDDSEEEGDSTTSTTEPQLYVKNSNVWFGKKDSQDKQLSQYGSEEHPYDEGHLHLSPDNRYAVAWQYTPEQDHKIHLVESSPDDQIEPKLHTVQYLKPGDRVRIDRPRLFDLESHREIPTDNALFRNPYKIRDLGWNKSGHEYRFLFNERGHQHLRVIGIGIDGQVRTLIEEKSSTFVDYTKLYVKLLKESDELVWSSERDGYNHLYLIDLAQGSVKNQITSGAWSVGDVQFIKEDERRIWLHGYGPRPEQDPYYKHLCCVNLDGSGFKILTEGDGTHSWSWSPDKRFFIDTWSRVDLAPTTVLRDGASGEMLLELSKVSMEELEKDGWASPERFSAPGRDGETMIYGIIIHPAEFDSSKKYPVLDEIYAGPHDFHVPKAFSALARQRKWADQGYVVVQVDGMGTNHRSKAFHDVCYKNVHDSGLPDHIAWLKAAAETRPWLDLSRVGIMGGSAGGQSAAAALLHHGDFYKAAAADSGCHDNRMDKLWWNELWMGYPVDEAYAESSNVTHAAKLRGALMLIVGELDDNVDPSSTFQFVKALNKAGKNYELVLIPGGEHGCGGSLYGLARQREFFRRYLQEGEKVRVDLDDAVSTD
ncbi:hypothetical protein CEP51_015581 [Fusarium floridanum]|uniref:Probable dipeptidyl-aminopeptidase B n=1 Tax=Fusarium floridanum TaxID=1325733 RepID=A0A428P7B7_9HYPO|nr:hypothetical protein CEP51_015581 [Fusarium floridanum]